MPLLVYKLHPYRLMSNSEVKRHYGEIVEMFLIEVLLTLVNMLVIMVIMVHCVQHAFNSRNVRSTVYSMLVIMVIRVHCVQHACKGRNVWSTVYSMLVIMVIMVHMYNMLVKVMYSP